MDGWSDAWMESHTSVVDIVTLARYNVLDKQVPLWYPCSRVDCVILAKTLVLDTSVIDLVTPARFTMLDMHMVHVWYPCSRVCQSCKDPCARYPCGRYCQPCKI